MLSYRFLSGKRKALAYLVTSQLTSRNQAANKCQTNMISSQEVLGRMYHLTTVGEYKRIAVIDCDVYAIRAVIVRC